MKILLLNDNSYINNFGCQATISALMKLLSQNLPDGEIRTVRQDSIAQRYTRRKKVERQTLKSKLKGLFLTDEYTSVSVAIVRTLF